VCGSFYHWVKKCPHRKGRKPQPKQKTSNMVLSSSEDGTSRYGNLPYVLSVFQSTLGDLILVQTFMCVMMFRYSLLTSSSGILLC
jgi:hypothetical protein